MKSFPYFESINTLKCGKIVSVSNGKIKLNNLEDAVLYADTQCIHYQHYASLSGEIDYMQRIAELMQQEGRNRLAARCYLKMMTRAWHNALIGCFLFDNEDNIKTQRIDELFLSTRNFFLDNGYGDALKELLKIRKRYYRELAEYRRVHKQLLRGDLECRILLKLQEMGV